MSGQRARAAAAPGARSGGEPGRVPGSAGQGASGRVGARARGCGRRRGGGGGSWGAGPRRPPGKRRGVLTAGPPGVIYMLSQPRADSWACSSLTGSLAHSLSAPATAQPAQPRGARERESQRAGEGGSKGGRERGRALALPLPCCPPFLLPQVRRAPLTLGKLRTALEPRVAPGGGGRAAPASRGGGGGRGGSEPEGSAQSCLSSCFYSHPGQHSQEGAEPRVAGFRR